MAVQYTLAKIVFINGEKVDINALDITNDKGEALDFGILHIPFSTKKENYQLTDEIKIFIHDTVKLLEYDKMIILSDKVKRVSKVDKIYSHTISFIESIKPYEKVLNTNIAITQSIGAVKKSLLDVLQLLRNKLPFERTSFHNTTRLFEIDTDLATYLDGITAPQFFFTNISLREMINQVASFVNGIGRMEDDNVLIFDFFNEILSLIGIEENILNRELTADFKNFGTTVDVDVQNVVMSDDIARGKITFPSETSWFTPRATTLKLQDTAYEFRLERPIFEMGTVTANVKTDLTTINTLTEININQQVVEKAVWDRLPLDAQTTGERKLGDYKANTLYWEYSKSTIKNNSLFGVGNISNTFKNVIQRALERTGVGNGSLFPPTEGMPDLDKFMIRVQYIPYSNVKMRQQKANANDVGVNLQIPTTPSGRLTSGERLMKNTHGLVERLGNDEIIVEKFGTALADLFEVGDYFKENGKFVLIRRKISFNRHDYEVTYEFTKNFNRISKFTIIDQEDRQYDIPLNKQQVIRHDIYEEYIEMDVVPADNNTLITPFGNETNINTFRSTRSTSGGRGNPGEGNNKSLDIAVVKSADMTDGLLQNANTGLHRIVTKTGEGTALLFSWEFDDVLKAGDRTIEDGFVSSVTGSFEQIKANANVLYTDDNGELETMAISYHSGADYSGLADANFLPLIVIPDNPLIGGHGRDLLESNDTFTVLKDRSETLGMSYMIHVVPNYQWVDYFVIGNEAIKNNNLIYELSNTQALYIWTSDTETYTSSTDNMLAKGTQTIADYNIVIQGDTYATATFSVKVLDNILTDGLKSWGLADSSGKLYLGVNQIDQNVSEVFFNCRNKRSGIKYRFDNQQIIGEQPPEMPTNLQFSNLLKTGFTATWLDNSIDSDEFNYKLLDENATIVASGILPITTLTYVATGLIAGKDYTFKVRTKRGLFYSNYATGEVTTEPPIPIAPTGGNITNIGTTSFTMNWTDNAEYEDGFRLYISNENDPTYVYYGSVLKNIQSMGVSGLSEGTKYYVRVSAYNTSEGNLQESTTYALANATTNVTPPPQTATPTIYSVSAIDTEIYFKVLNNDGSTATIRYELNDSTPDIVFGSVVSGGNTGTISISANPSTTYTIYATAIASGESMSNYDSYSIRTADSSNPPDAPSSFNATVNLSTIEFSWTDNSNNEDGFIVEIHTNSGYTALYRSTQTGANVTYLDEIVATGTYYARVKSFGEFGSSSWINCTANPITVA